ncbi:TMEM14 family [Trypanosoma melophagium]|uniref:TMEM14 family n=1 Tax=Trypanosoma melophagium TaxID=715481 RepID=UPI00351A575A|nr:TMEM14 family [Trypanosoma melophagium]
MSSPYVAATLGALLQVGGVMGYVRKGSKASFIAGTATGLIMALTVPFLWVNANHKNANRVAAATTLLLTVAMGARYLKHQSTVPLVVSSLSGLSFFFSFAPHCL